LEFNYSKPINDSRSESCRVHEESIELVGDVTSKQKRENLVNPVVVASEIEAASKGNSLALIRPENVSLTWRKRSDSELAEARKAFEQQAKQSSMFDKDLDIIEPCPFEFKMQFSDGDGKTRNKKCSDWETSAAYFNLSRKFDEQKALEHLQTTYCDEYVRTGLVFALGNMAKRPQTWQLLGIFPTARSGQTMLEL